MLLPSARPAFLAALLLGAVGAPAYANHDENATTPATAPAQEGAPAPDETVYPEAMPTNDLSSSAASKISAPALGAGGSLHASPKIMNNTGLTNDLKSTLRKAQPAIAPGKPPVAGNAAPIPAEPVAAAPSAAPAGNAEPEGYELQVAGSGASGAPAAVDASEPAAPRPGSPLPALIGLALVAVGGGFVVARMLRARAKG